MRIAGLCGLAAALGVVCLTLGSAACGSSASPSTPSTPSGPTVSKIALTLQPVVKLGTTLQATATVTYSDGTTSSTAATFTGDNPAVATVSATGLVTPVGYGTVNVAAAAGNQSVSEAVRVLPDLSGNWSGSAVVASCSSASLNCQATGSTEAFTVNIGQSDGTVPTAFFATGGVQITLSGTIATNGTLTMSGSGPITDPSVDTITVQNWTSTVTSPGVMSGSFTLLGSKSGTTLITTNLTFQGLTRQ